MAKLPADSFEVYFAQGPSRSYQKLADHYGVAKNTVVSRAKSENWQERIEHREEEARRLAEKKAVETLEEMTTRHLRALKILQARALETLRSTPLNTAMEAARCLDMSIKQERIIRGEPAERTALSVEEAIKSEYQRWLTVDADDEESCLPE